MADTFTGTLNLCKPEIDQSAETWGQKLNADLDLLDTFATNVNAFIANNNATIQYFINLVLPRGVIMAWANGVGTIPAGWLLCNGANGTPNLTDRFILGHTGNRTNWEAGGSFSTSAVTDAQGQHQHAGAVTATAIGEGQMPYHNHYGVTDGQGSHAHTYTRTNQGTGAQPGGAPVDSVAYFGERGEATSVDGFHQHNIATDFRGGNQGHTHGVYWDGNHAHNVAVTTVPPYFALCYIMRA